VTVDYFGQVNFSGPSAISCC